MDSTAALAPDQRVLVLCWFDRQKVVLPGRVISFWLDHQQREFILFEIDDGQHGRWRVSYPRAAESITWGREGETTAGALQSAYALSTLPPMPAGPTGSQGPRLSAVWL